MKKNILFLIYLLIFSDCNAFCAYVTADVLNVRSDAGIDAGIIDKIKNKQYVKIIRSQGDWVYISWYSNDAKSQKNGWVSKKYLSAGYPSSASSLYPSKYSSSSGVNNSYADINDSDILKINDYRLKCNESLYNGGFDGCTLEIDVYYYGDVKKSSIGNTIYCEAGLDYYSVGEYNYGYNQTERISGDSYVYKNQFGTSTIYIKHNFYTLSSKVIRASVRNISCEVKKY